MGPDSNMGREMRSFTERNVLVRPKELLGYWAVAVTSAGVRMAFDFGGLDG